MSDRETNVRREKSYGKSWHSMFRDRLSCVFLIVVVAFVVVCSKQLYMQFVQHGDYKEKAVMQQIDLRRVKMTRGDIRDVNGVILATSSTRHTVGFNVNLKYNTDLEGMHYSLDGVPEKLAAILHESPDKVRDDFEYSRKEGAYCPIKFQAPDDEVEPLRELQNAEIQAIEDMREERTSHPDAVEERLRKTVFNWGGLIIDSDTPDLRLYPEGPLAAQLLGGVGGEGQGVGGLEATYDSLLSGKNGQVKQSVDNKGNAVPLNSLKVSEWQEGRNLVLSIDSRFQYIVERELARRVKETNAVGGICAMMNVKTGEIMALAMNPTFDPAHYEKADPNAFRLRALTDPYEPGSIFKPFLAAAAIERGAEPSSVYSCPSNINLDGGTIHNAADGLFSSGSESLRNILAYSFNTGTTMVAFDIGKEALYDTYIKFGFGHSTGIDVEGEDEGYLTPCKEWGRNDTASASFGQGVIVVTPLQLLSAMQAIGNDGVRLRPHVVKRILDNDGQLIEEKEPEVLGQACSPATARKMRDILTSVVTYGSGKPAKVKGYKVGGKTGTAQIAKNGAYVDGLYNAGFLGLAPIDDPQIVILVKIEEPKPLYYGGAVAGPVFSRICQQVLPRMNIVPTPGYTQEGAEIK